LANNFKNNGLFQIKGRKLKFTQDKVVLCNFSIANLLRQSVVTVVNVGIKTERIQMVSNFSRIRFLRRLSEYELIRVPKEHEQMGLQPG
jgi:hypothetical protein